jgi:hypothetical protein
MTSLDDEFLFDGMKRRLNSCGEEMLPFSTVELKC